MRNHSHFNFKTPKVRTQIIASGLSLLLCANTLTVPTYAWFTDSLSKKAGNIKSATYEINVTNGSEQSVAGIDTLPLSQGDEHVYYLTAGGSASTGYCTVTVRKDNTEDSVTVIDPIAPEQTVRLTLTAAAGSTVEFAPSWGKPQEGTTVVIPAASYAVRGEQPLTVSLEISRTASAEYTVTEETTLEALEQEYGVAAQDILTYNGLETLTPGETILIPDLSGVILPETEEPKAEEPETKEPETEESEADEPETDEPKTEEPETEEPETEEPETEEPETEEPKTEEPETEEPVVEEPVVEEPVVEEPEAEEPVTEEPESEEPVAEEPVAEEPKTVEPEAGATDSTQFKLPKMSELHKLAENTVRASAPEEDNRPSYLVNDVPLYFQNDYPDVMYGSGTVATSGCSVTCLAMVASAMTDYDYTPDELADYFGGRAENNIQRLEIGSDALGLAWSRSGNWDITMQALQDGKMVIALMEGDSLFTQTQHFIVLTGLNEEGLIMVNDPANYNYTDWQLQRGFVEGFKPNDILKGYSGGWIYDRDAMPEEPAPRYEEKRLDRSASRYGIELTGEERELLARMIWVEARGECAEGQQAVAEVVLNRLVSGKYAETLRGVIYDQGQFESTPLLKDAEPYQAQYQAIDRALYGDPVLPEDVFYFATFKKTTDVWGQIGGHYFCR